MINNIVVNRYKSQYQLRNFDRFLGFYSDKRYRLLEINLQLDRIN